MRIRRESSTNRRRQLRQPGTDAEVLLWQRLRSRQVNGCKFRRQHSIGPYILDFFCIETQLGVEVDGDHHADASQRAYDARRNEYLASRGIRVLRFSDRDVLTETDSVLDAIVKAIEGALT
jgi:very-short-patch-repair endonuclease